MQLKHSFTRFVFPFSYDAKNIDHLVKSLDQKVVKHPEKVNKEFQVWERVDEVDSCFLPHLRNIILERDNSHYFYRRRITRNLLDIVFRYDNKINNLTATNKKLCIDFTVQSIEFALIRSGIGFVIIEMSLMTGQSVNNLIDFNYYTKYIEFKSVLIQFSKSNINEMQIKTINGISEKLINWECLDHTKMGNLFRQTIVNDSIYTQGVSFLEVIDWVQSLAFKSQSDYNNNLIANQTYVFSYLHTDPTNEIALKKYLFLLRRAFKNSYHPSKDHVSDSSKEYINTFDNIHFGVALEGSCIWTVETGDVFFDQFEHRVRDRYFIMYLLNLHNRVALLNFRDQLDIAFPGLESTCVIENKETIKVRKLRNKIFSFYMKFHFKTLTNVTHLEEINLRIHEIMLIDSLIEEIKGKTNELDEYLMSQNDRKISKGLSSLTIIGFVLAPLSIVTSFFCISFYPLDGGVASNAYQIKSYILALVISITSSILLSLLLLRNKNYN